MLFKSYLKSSKKHISFCVNKSQNHTNRFGKASHFVLAIVYCKSERNLPYYRFKVVSRFIRCNMGNLDTQEVDVSDNTMHLEEVSCPLRGSGDCFFENIVCKPKSTLPLTPQQRRVYKLYADGLNTVEIAEAMCLAIATIERHRKDIQQRLSLHSLSDMISFYHKKHLNLD